MSAPRRLPSCNLAVHERELDGEFILLNLQTNEVHVLSGQAAAVWRAARAGEDVTLINSDLAPVVDGLIDLGLLESPGYSRRSLLRTAAVGGMALAVTGITSSVLPSAAAAYSATGTQTYSSNDQIIVSPGQTIYFTLVGGGGGGAGGAVTYDGGSGGQGAIISGSYTAPTGGDVPVDLVVGLGGSLGTGTASGAGGVSAYAAGGAGSDGNATARIGGGGGGGGASALISHYGQFAFAVAGGGGGGDGATLSGAGLDGGAGSSSASTTANATAEVGPAATSPGGGGAGGGANTNATAGVPGVAASTGGGSYNGEGTGHLLGSGAGGAGGAPARDGSPGMIYISLS